MTKLFIAGIPWKTTEEELGEYFAQCGEVLSVKIILDHETNKSRGFGFVEFNDSQAAQEAIKRFNNVEFMGRNIQVKEALPKR